MASSTIANQTPRGNPYIQTYDAQAFENSDVIVTQSATLISVVVTNKSASAVFLQLFNATAVPANTTVPSIVPIAVPAGTTVKISFNDTGAGYDGTLFKTGLCWAGSSTAGTLTQDTTNSLWVMARYI